jgi:hypothetical protein
MNTKTFIKKIKLNEIYRVQTEFVEEVRAWRTPKLFYGLIASPKV